MLAQVVDPLGEGDSQDQVAVGLHEQVGRAVHGVQGRALCGRSKETPSAPLHAGAECVLAECEAAVGSVEVAGCCMKAQVGQPHLHNPKVHPPSLTWGRFWLARSVPGVVGLNPPGAGGAVVAGGAMDSGFRGMRGSSVTGAHSAAVRSTTQHAALQASLHAGARCGSRASCCCRGC